MVSKDWLNDEERLTMIGTERKGLSRVKELYQGRTCRARELKSEGKKLIGYFDIYPVLEMLTALDLVPYAILGDMDEPITRADACLPTVVCRFIRSVMDLGLKGRYDFLDGVVWAHTCEVAEKTSHIWRDYLNPSYAHFIDTPHTTHATAVKRHKELLKDFQKTLESFTGKEISPQKLREAIETHNEQRALVRALYELRKADPPRISGTETLQVMVALASIPVGEGIDLLRQVITEVEQRRNGPARPAGRLLIWGSMLDNTALIDMIESLGANVVMDDTYLGSRAYFPMVELTDDPLAGLAYRYLVELRSPRTFRDAAGGEGKQSDYMSDLQSRYGYLGDYIKGWSVNGVILQTMRYCDIHSYEVPGLRDYLESIGLPSIYLEHDYSRSALAQLRTRIQAFLEVIS